MADFSAFLEVLKDVMAEKNPRVRFSGTKITTIFKDLRESGFVSKESGKYQITEKGKKLIELIEGE